MNKIQTEKISLPVEGMTCASCVARVEKTVAKFEGISKVNVNLATEKVTLEYDPAVVDLNKACRNSRRYWLQARFISTAKRKSVYRLNQMIMLIPILKH